MKYEEIIHHAHTAWEKASQLAPPPKPPRLHFYLPAMPSMRLIHALDMGWWHYRRRRLFRRHILPLLAYDDQLLRDIGHCCDDIRWASQLPLKVDAIQALKERSNNLR